MFKLYANKKHGRHLLMLLLAVAILSGCVGPGLKSVVIRDQELLTNLELPVGGEKSLELTIEPADAELSYTSADETIALVPGDGQVIIVEALQIGETVITLKASREGYQTVTRDITVAVVSDPEDEILLEVKASLLDEEYTAGEPLVLLIHLMRHGEPVFDGEYLVKVCSEDDETSLEEQALVFADGAAELVLTEPLTETGEHILIIKVDDAQYSLAVNVLPAEERIETETPPETELEVESLQTESMELQAALSDPQYVAGEPLVLNIRLTHQDVPVPDGEYYVALYSEQSETGVQAGFLPFAAGEAELVLSEPLTKAGIYSFTAAVEAAQHSFTVAVLPGEPAELKLASFPERGTAQVPLESAVLYLVDAYGNALTEGGRVISVSVQGGFKYGDEQVATDEWGLAVFSGLTLYEGEYMVSFTYEELEVVSPLLIVDLQGTGEAESPYLINNLYGLQSIGKDVSAHYQLGSDIDASATADVEAGWQPIEGFAGSLRGSGYSIHSLYINRPQSDQVGLFASIASGGSVTDLTLAGAVVTGKSKVGSLAGRNLGDIVNCTVIDAQVQGQNQAIGGLAGENQGTVLNSSTEANVTGATNVGGLVGLNAGIIEHSSAAGTTSASGISSFAGGLVGNNRGTILRSYALGEAQGSPVGGLVGHNQNHGSGVITESYAAVSLVGTGNRGGLTGLNFGTVSKSYFDRELSGTRFGSGTGKSTLEMKQADTYADWDFTQIWEISTEANNGYPVLKNSE